MVLVSFLFGCFGFFSFYRFCRTDCALWLLPMLFIALYLLAFVVFEALLNGF